jgi:outer membrane protein insertion porin family
MYTPLDRNKNPLVLYTKVNFGVLAPYNKAVGNSPFERFYIGGSGLTGVNNITGNEIIPLRGYADYQSWGTEANSNGGVAAAKYTAEVRFPFSLNPSATVFGLAFAEAGNNFSELSDFDPFDMKRSAGVGLRVFLPMFGLLGLDYGWAFDSLNGSPIDRTGQFTFTIGGNISGW